MLAATLYAKWNPKPEYKPTPKDVEGKLTYLGGMVWRYPELRLVEREKPKIKDDEVLIQVKACGICGSDVHMYESFEDGYIKYPGLTAFPVTLGHEFSGVIVEVGKRAYGPNGKKFKVDTPVTSEEMIWCGNCKPCRDGFPNHCRNLEELGFSRDGAMAEYVASPARCCWPIDELIDRLGEKRGYEAGALVEPTSVSYNGMFIRAGGIKPGEYVIIFGAGPIGLAATALAKASGATKVIVSEISKKRAELARLMGADEVLNPLKINSMEEKLLELTEGEGADMYIEAAGAFGQVWPVIEKCIWKGEKLNAKVVAIGRAVEHVPLWFEVLQVRRAQIYGTQGHAGHGIFANVIRLMASGRIDMTPIITKRFRLSDAVKAMEFASKEKSRQGKILVKP